MKLILYNFTLNAPCTMCEGLLCRYSNYLTDLESLIYEGKKFQVGGLLL